MSRNRGSAWSGSKRTCFEVNQHENGWDFSGLSIISKLFSAENYRNGGGSSRFQLFFEHEKREKFPTFLGGSLVVALEWGMLLNLGCDFIIRAEKNSPQLTWRRDLSEKPRRSFCRSAESSTFDGKINLAGLHHGTSSCRQQDSDYSSQIGMEVLLDSTCIKSTQIGYISRNFSNLLRLEVIQLHHQRRRELTRNFSTNPTIAA